MPKRRLCGNWYVNVVEHSPTIRNRYDVEIINIKDKKVFTHPFLTMKSVNALNRMAKKVLCKK